MARGSITHHRTAPVAARVLTLQVLGSERISEHFMRVSLGGADIADFTPMGFDQWFRLFVPVSDDSLSRLPAKLDTVSYLRYLAISKAHRPVLRNYTVRAWHPDGPSLDVDVVVHDPAGPAARWALECEPGSFVGLLDEGTSYLAPPDTAEVVLVADESGVPAVEGVLRSLDRSARGTAILEVPSAGDRRPLDSPEGFDVRWLVRSDPAAVPGVAALAAASELAFPDPAHTYGWVVGEQALAAGTRRAWVSAGVPKDRIMFCGYWRHGRAQY